MVSRVPSKAPASLDRARRRAGEAVGSAGATEAVWERVAAAVLWVQVPGQE